MSYFGIIGFRTNYLKAYNVFYSSTAHFSSQKVLIWFRGLNNGKKEFIEDWNLSFGIDIKLFTFNNIFNNFSLTSFLIFNFLKKMRTEFDTGDFFSENGMCFSNLQTSKNKVFLSLY